MTNRYKTFFIILIPLLIILSSSFVVFYSIDKGNMVKQLTLYSICLIVFFAIAYVHFIKIWVYAYPIYWINFLLVAVIEIIGIVGMGARRWINFYVVHFQPSEIMKISIVLAIAKYCATHDINKVVHCAKAVAIIAMPFVLILKQPDLGTAIMILGSSLSIIFVAGIHIRIIVFAVCFFVISLPLIWNSLYLYQQTRIMVFLGLDNDQYGAGYQVLQSIIAIGGGGLTGKGFQGGSQSNLGFLPANQTDFAFSVLCEEFGFIGGISVVLSFALLCFYPLTLLYKTNDKFIRLVMIGIMSNIFLYCFANIGMVIGLLPVVGVPLPFISKGGTAGVVFMINIGIIVACSRYINTRSDIALRRYNLWL